MQKNEACSKLSRHSNKSPIRMTAKRTRKKPCSSDLGNLFRSLASAIASGEVNKQPHLNRLVYLLGHLSMNGDVASHSWKIKQVVYLSDVLFTELDRCFQNLFSTLCQQEQEGGACAGESLDVAILFLRCCLKMLALLMPRQELVLDKAKLLLSILSGLIRAKDGDCSFVFTQGVPPLDPRYTFLCTGIEVFMDAILLNKSIRDLLFLVDSAFSSCRLFSKHDTARLMEMLSAHFVFSASHDQMRVDRLCWMQDNAFRTPQISWSAAVPLLITPLMFSAPTMIHAYVVLLVSDAIGISSPPSVKGLDHQLKERYIDVVEKSVVLYTRHMCKGDNASSGKFGLSTTNSPMAFEHLLSPSTLEKVNHLTMKLKDAWDSYQSNNAKTKNDELVANSVAYAKVSLSVFDSSCSENMLSQALSVLACVILRASSDDVMDSVLQKYNTSSMEDLYLLSSTVKLISCSMLQAIRALRNWNGHSSESVRGCQEYKAMMDVVQRFELFDVHLPGHSFLRDKMEAHPHSHVKSKWMLMHFSGLLSVSFALKLDFLVKDSIFGMVVSLYLFILEGGDLEALGSSVCHSENQSSPLPSTDSKILAASGKAEVTGAGRKLSGAVASRFKKIRTLFLGKVSEAKDQEKGSKSGEGVEEESCNGESFLWCVTRKRRDVEELADFIACEPGKDYTKWLKGRERFQRWKSEKVAIQRWHKKQKAWREKKRSV